MSNDKNNEFHGELLPPEVIRKGIYELGNVNRIPPSVGIFDAPTRCFVVNLEWWSHIAGMVHLLADVVSWQEAEDESYFAIIEILKFMQGIECMDFMMRQSPDDSCILQQTTDGGTTWTDVFDFSQCATIQDQSYQVMINESVSNYVPTIQDIYNNYVANYAGTPASVYPDLSPPSGDKSAYNAAYCNAIATLVRSVSDAAVDYYNESLTAAQNEFNFFVGVSLFVVAAIGIAGAIPTGGASLTLTAMAGQAGLVAAGIGLAAGLVNFGVDYLQAHTVEQFQDVAAREEVICYLVDEVSSTANTKAAMIAALTGHGLTGNAGVIADFLGIAIQADVTYAAFLDKWHNNMEYAQAGINLECPCADEYKVWVWDFSNGLGNFSLGQGTLAANGVQAVYPGSGAIKIMTLTMPHNPSWRIVAVKVHTIRSGGNANGTQDTISVRLRPTAGTDTGSSFMGIGGFRPNGTDIGCNRMAVAPLYWTGGNQLAIDNRVANGSTTGQLTMTKIEIQYINEFSPTTGYVTDDDNICT